MGDPFMPFVSGTKFYVSINKGWQEIAGLYFRPCSLIQKNLEANVRFRPIADIRLLIGYGLIPQ